MGEENRPRTAQAVALSDIRRQILTGVLRPGQRIIQDALAARLGISRVPVREALQQLQGEGLVEYMAHFGYQVTSLNYDDIKEIYYLRQVLESDAIRLAIPLLSDVEVEEMSRTRAQMEQLPEWATDQLAGLNREFHFLLFRAAKMPRLLRFIGQLWDASDAYRTLYHSDSAAVAEIHHEHRQLQDAIDARDVDRVIEVFDLHRGGLLEFLQRKLAPVQQRSQPVDSPPDIHSD